MTTATCAPSDTEGAERARNILEKLIQAVEAPGFYGQCIIEISVQNGMIGQVEELVRQTHKVNR